MRLTLRSEVRLFEDAQLKQILDAALKVFRQVPFVVQGTDEFMDLLSAYGCRIEGEKVFFPGAVVDKVLARCEQDRRAWQAPACSPPEPEMSVFTHGQALHICDPETNALRSVTTADLASWCQLVEALDISSRSHPTFIPNDGPIGSCDLRAFTTILLNSSRAHLVSVYSAAMLPFFIAACEATQSPPVFAAKAWITSPYMLDGENVAMGMDARRLLGKPIEFGHMPVAGASTPITVAGALVQNTAESLAISALRLAVDDLPQKITGTSAVMDMRHGFPRQIGPDLFLHRVAGIEMDDFLYRQPGTTSRAWGWCGAGAATVSTQSVLEKAFSVGFAGALGARSFGVGSLAFSDVGSPVQLMIDLELIDYLRGLMREVVVDPEHIGMDEILDVAPRGGRYLQTMHTAQFFREECWLPQLCDYRAFMAWANNPGDLIAKARDKVLAIQCDAVNPCPLSDEARRQLHEIQAEADRVVS
jgi:trimethylamine---corrinoid protein Co-methyltransferase